MRRREACVAAFGLVAGASVVPPAGATGGNAAVNATGSRSILSLGGDPSGAVDSTTAFVDALSHPGHVRIPAGTYRLANKAAIELAPFLTVEGDGPVILEKHGASAVPLLRSQGASGLTLRNIGFSNRIEEEVWHDRHSGAYPVPWALADYAAVVVTLEIEGAGQRRLQIGRDFRLRDLHGVPTVELQGEAATLPFRRLRLNSVAALAPFISLVDTDEILLEDLRCVHGSIEVVAKQSEPRSICIRACEIRHGQIRVIAGGDTIIPTRTGVNSPANPRAPQGIHISGNVIEGPITPETTQRYLTFTERVHGIVVHGFARFVTISQNTAFGTEGDGIWIASCADVIVSGNRCTYNGLSGIGLENDLVRRVQRCVLSGNECSFNWFDGIDFNFGTLKPGKDGGPMTLRPAGDLDTALVSITGNVLHGNGGERGELSGGCGLFANRVRYATIQGNVMTGNYLAGLLADGCEGLAIVGNLCVGNGRAGKEAPVAGRAGIGLRGTSRSQLAGNVLGNSPEHKGQAFGIVVDTYRASRPGQTEVAIPSVKNGIGPNSHTGNEETDLLHVGFVRPDAPGPGMPTLTWSESLGQPLFWNGERWTDAFGNGP